MSIQSRIKDAEVFWKEGLKEKALLAALSAAKDTARKRYPQAKDGREALTHFAAYLPQFAGSGADTLDWTFRGGTFLGEVLYDVFRTLLATGELPADVELDDGKEFQILLLEGNRRGFTDSLIPRLIEAVKEAPENAKEFSKRK